MAFSRFADIKRGPAVPQKETVPDSAIVPELLVKVELGIMTKEVAKGLVQKVVDAEEKLFTDKVLSDPILLLQTVAAFNQYKASVYSIGSGCFILGLVFLQIDDVDTFYHEHYKLGPGTLSDKLTGILISDSLRNKVNGANLIVRLQVKQEDYLRVRRRLENGIRRTTSVDNLATVLLQPGETDIHPVLNSLDLATTSTQDSSFTHWVNNPYSRQLGLMVRKKAVADARKVFDRKYEIAKHQIELQGDMVRSLQREVTRLTQEQETAQKLLLDNKKEIEDLTGANKGMENTIGELLAEKTKLANKLAMKEHEEKLTADKVESLQREVTHLTPEKEAAQKELSDKRKELEDLTGASKGNTTDERIGPETDQENAKAIANMGHVVKEKQLDTLAKKLGAEWESLAIQLGLTASEVFQCKADNMMMVDGQIFSMLMRWRSKKGSNATVEKLIEELRAFEPPLDKEKYEFLEKYLW